jgi:hypothetical protein
LPVGTDIENIDAHKKRNSFENLIDGQFEGMISLKKIDFEGCNITNIEELAFQGLMDLVDLDLRNNHIKNLHGNLFKDLKGLKNIFLQENEIRQLSPNLFKNNKALTEIDLTLNKIFAIGRSTFIGLSNLTTLKLDDNKCVKQDELNSAHSAHNFFGFYRLNNLNDFEDDDSEELELKPNQKFVNMTKVDQSLIICYLNYEFRADSNTPLSVDSMFQQIQTWKNLSPHYIWFVVVSGLSSFLSIFGVTVIVVLGAKILKLSRMQNRSQENVDGAAETTDDIYQNTF